MYLGYVSPFFFIRRMGGAYGERKMFDFFVRHLQGTDPPEWNKGKPTEVKEVRVR